MARKRIFVILKYLLFLGVGIGLLWYVSSKIDIRILLSQLKKAHYQWVVLSGAIALLSHLSRAARWNLLIRSLGYPTRLTTTFHATMIGYLSNMAIPRLGEITRCGVLARKGKIPLQNLVGTVLVERGIDMLSFLLIIGITVVVQLNQLENFLGTHIWEPLQNKWAAQREHVWIYLVVLIVLAVLGILAMRWGIRKFRAHGGKYYFKFRRILVGFMNGLRTIATMPGKGLFVMHTVFIWLCYFLMVYVCFFAMDATSHLGVGEGFTILTTGSLGILAPVPGGVGTYHTFVAYTLEELYNISADSSVSFAYLVHGTQYIVMAVTGGLSLLVITLSYRKNAN